MDEAEMHQISMKQIAPAQSVGKMKKSDRYILTGRYHHHQQCYKIESSSNRATHTLETISHMTSDN